MIIPIKFNKSFWPKFLTFFLPSSYDPSIIISNNFTNEDFSKAVSVLKFKKVYKLTSRNRYPLTMEAVVKFYDKSKPVILEVGASDGISAINFLQIFEFKKYYITDLNTEVYYHKRRNSFYFYDSEKELILIITRLFIIYPDFKVLKFIYKIILRFIKVKEDNTHTKMEKVVLINPEILAIKKNVEIKKYNIFETWDFEKIDLIIVANLLNRSYFDNNQIKLAVQNLVTALNSEGVIAVIENRDVEKSTIFYIKSKKVSHFHDINGGTEIKDLILEQL